MGEGSGLRMQQQQPGLAALPRRVLPHDTN